MATKTKSNKNGNGTHINRIDEVMATEGDGVVPSTPLAGKRSIKFTPVKKSQMELTLIGLTPLLMHRMSKRALDKIEANQTGQPVPDEHRRPKLEFREAQYFVLDNHPELIEAHTVEMDEKILGLSGKFKNNDGDVHGFPVVAVFRAMERACKYVKGLKMTDAPALFTVLNDGNPHVAELSVITYETVQYRRDRVRIPNGPTTLAYRALFDKWKMNIKIEFNSEIVSPEMCYNVIERAGSVGIGAWRPQCRGVFGRFAVDPDSVQVTEDRPLAKKK